MRSRVAGALVAVAVSGLSSSAVAVETGAVNISVSGGPAPVELQPGGTATTSFVVRNPAPYEQHVVIEVQGLTAGDGGYQFGGPLPPGISVVSDPADLMVAAGEARDVHVVITAEPATPAGGAYAGLIVRSIPDVASNRSPVIGEIGLPVLMNVGGASNDAGHIVSFVQPADHSLAFDTTFANTGNVHYLYGGVIELFTGAVSLGTVPVDSRLILPGTTRSLHVAWPGDVTFSNLRARLTFQWGAGKRRNETREIAVARADSGAIKAPAAKQPAAAIPGPNASPVVPVHPERTGTFTGPHAGPARPDHINASPARQLDTPHMALLAVASGMLGTLLPLLFLFGRRKRREKRNRAAETPPQESQEDE
jgi:hypothetical protein